jgi:CheY-like chemotaxis protein
MIKVLLVEDNPMICEMIAERLGLMGYQTDCAPSAEIAIEQARVEQPEVILMDISLPGMDGWEATEKLKADARTRDIPVIALTAHAMVEARERSLEAGCSDFETKPVNFTRLAEKIEALASG